MTSETSYAAFRWLTYIEEFSQDLMNKNGERVPLEHRYYRGEKEIFNWKIDGYANVDGKDLFYEFLGCHHHDCCPSCKPGQIDEAWESKKQYLETHGQLTFIHECRWRRICTTLHAKRSLHWGKIFMRHDEEFLLTEIKHERVFGFIVADVTCPQHVYEEIAHMNFPPIIKRMNLTEKHVSNYMKGRAAAAGRKMEQETVVQTYNGQGILMLTSMAAFYMRLGLVVSNVKQFTQYRAEKCLEEFVNKITDGRINSIDAKKESLANAFKTVGNW